MTHQPPVPSTASPRRPRVALVTCAAVPDLANDRELVPALGRFGTVEVVVWDDPDVDWSGFDVVLIRSTWDYLADVDAFLAWAERVGRRTRLVNPAEVLRWNSDKRYLADLAAAGVPILPTSFVRPDEADAGAATEQAVRTWAGTGPVPDVVVKPARSAAALGAGRFSAVGPAVAHARTLLAAGQTVLVQPYMGSVDSQWETGVYLVGGVATHAVRKRGLLRPDVAPATDYTLVVTQQIVPADLDPARVEFARRVLDAVPFPPGSVTYARVDIVDGPDGPLLIEVELIEPCLFLDLVPGAVGRVADALRGTGLLPAGAAARC